MSLLMSSLMLTWLLLLAVLSSSFSLSLLLLSLFVVACGCVWLELLFGGVVTGSLQVVNR